jgi:hypothetical protein
MINRPITSSDSWLTVSDNPGTVPYINTYGNNNQSLQGLVKYETATCSFQVYDGTSWQTIGSGGQTIIGFSSYAQKIMQWASTKMMEEQNRAYHASQHPTVASAVEDVKKAEERLELVIKLCQEYETIAGDANATTGYVSTGPSTP